jgi:hypothetical protein
MLFMTGADPAAANQAAALRHLREFVHRHRYPCLCIAPLQIAVHAAALPRSTFYHRLWKHYICDHT